jgi:flagellar biosynthesis repressor protein FlbT
MSNLVLELRQGDMMIVNGAAIRFRNKARIELTSRARFLFGKQIMRPEQADSPARRIYLALQSAYVGDEPERPQALEHARQLIAQFMAATTSTSLRDILSQAVIAAETDDCYQALRLTRRVVSDEDAVLGRAPAADGAPSG